MLIGRIQIRSERAGPHLLITAGVHGDEFEPMLTVRELMDLVIDTGQVTLVACVNESAYCRGTRTGEDGLDLARICPGSSSGSISQRVAHELSELIRTADAYIDMHTGGTTLQITPLSGYVLHPKAHVLEAQRRMARAFNLPVIWGTHPAAEGRSLSVARDADIPAIYTETGGGGSCNQTHIDECMQGCRNVMRLLGMLHDDPPAPRVQQVVEDPRDDSGYLQIQHPAPMNGIFRPAVQLRQDVRQGEPIGRVCDALSNATEVVTANESGTVLMLRWFGHVNAGDALAAILPEQYRI